MVTEHTERSMLDMLRRHYLSDDRNPAWLFAPMIQAPGSTLRKADLICQGIAAATGGLLVGHEVKVGRADVLVELADLTKCDPWMRYCDQWYLVVPDLAILDGLQVPDRWGILTPPSGRRTRSMTVSREAPRLTPSEQAPALRTLAAWQHWRLRDLETANRDLTGRLERQDEVNRELRMHRPNHDPRRETVAKVLAALGGYGEHIGRWDQEVAADDVAAALRDLGEVYRRRDEAERCIKRGRENLEQIVSSAQFVLDKMDEHNQGGSQ